MEVSPTLFFRISRDRMLDLAPFLSPLPANDLPIEPEHYLEHLSHETLVVGTVAPDTTATITLPFSQPGVSYQLFFKNGTPVGGIQYGNCESLQFETPPLPREWHEFYIEAVKLNTDQPAEGNRKLRIEVWINSGHNDGVDPDPMLKILPFAGTYDLLIPDCPPKLRFRLTNREGAEPSPALHTGTKGGLLTFPLGPLYENDSFRIDVQNSRTGLERGLVQLPMVYVYPNPHLMVVLVSAAPVPYLGEAQLEVVDAQRSCTYQVVLGGEGGHGSPYPAVNGNGDRLSLFTGPLRDDVTVTIRATKVEGQLVANLNQRVTIPVYPDPTLPVWLQIDRVAYGDYAQVLLGRPQAGVQYQVETLEGQVVAGLRADNLRMGQLDWWIGPCQEDEIYCIRAFRHGVNALLYAQVQLYVGPRLDLPFGLSELQFTQSEGTHLVVGQSQASVHYTLYKIPGTDEEWANPIECSTSRGNGSELLLPTGELQAFRYRFFVRAYKPSSGMEDRLWNELFFELGVRRDVEPIWGEDILVYEGTTTVQLPNPQVDTLYRLIDSQGRVLSDWTESSPRGGISLETIPLQEDLLLMVEAMNRYVGNVATLHASQTISVYPNLNLQTSIESPVIDYGNTGSLRIHQAQASVVYTLTVNPLFPYAYNIPPPTLTYAAHPSADGLWDFDFGPLEYPVRFELQAAKALTGLSGPVPLADSAIRTRPNHTLVPEIVENNIPYNGQCLVYLPETDPFTYYELQDAEGNTLGFKSFSERSAPVTLQWGPFPEDIELYVHAFCELTGLRTDLHTSVQLFVRPNLGLLTEVEQLPFDPNIGLNIRVNPTQESADYTLMIIPGSDWEWGSAIRGITRAGNGGELRLSSGPLDHVRYTFYVHVQKRVSGLSGRPRSAVMLFAGVRKSCLVGVDFHSLEYGGTNTLHIHGTQPDAYYGVYTEEGDFLGGAESLGEGQSLTIPLDSMFEDSRLDIRCTNHLSNYTASLNARPEVIVAPFLHVVHFLDSHIADWLQPLRLHIPKAQKGVRYDLVLQGGDDVSWEGQPPIGQLVGSAENQLPWGFSMYTTALRYDLDFSIRAVKPNGLWGWVPGTLSVDVRPDHTLEVRAAAGTVHAGNSTFIIIPEPQLGVTYQLRLKDEGQPIGNVYYAGPPVGIGAAIVQYNLRVGRDEDDRTLYLPTGPLYTHAVFEVVATKLATGLSAILQTEVTIHTQLRR